ncbi:hypothetical protein [Klebsiella sp. 2680]
MRSSIWPGKVFPAPAGINRDFDLALRQYSSVPRASGDKPLALAFEPGQR